MSNLLKTRQKLTKTFFLSVLMDGMHTASTLERSLYKSHLLESGDMARNTNILHCTDTSTKGVLCKCGRQYHIGTHVILLKKHCF